jgi:hypothetical protein
LALGARSNFEKIYPIDDPSYKVIVDLYRIQGLALPSSSGPYSGSELMAMLERINEASLNSTEKEWYTQVRNTITGDASSPVFSGHLAVNEEMYLNTNSDSSYFQGRDNWIRGWANEKPFLQLISEEHIGNNFYGYFDFSLGVTKHLSNGREFGDSLFWSNTPFLLPDQNDMKQLDFNMPLRAFVSAGGNHWSFQMGRDRLSWGNGTTGNFIIGDHIKYHNMARIAAFDDNFKYTFLVSAFPHPQNYYKYDSTDTSANGVYTNGTGGVGHGQSHLLNGISMFIAHRLEWRTFWDHVGIALTEGVMYMSADNRIDLAVLNPAMLYHNNYTRSLSNSILGLEMDYTPIPGWNLYGQWVIDESVLPGEAIPGNDTRAAEPGAMGYMLGSTYTTTVGNGALSFNLEGAYTDPYLYLRDGDAQSNGGTGRNQEVGQYGINYVVAVREMIGAGGTEYYDEQFLGYKYGGDAIVGNLNVKYAVPFRWSVSGNLFYMAHGTHDKWTVWTQVNTEGMVNQTTPTTHHQTGNQKDSSATTTRDSVWHTFVAGVNGAMKFGHGFSGFLQTDYIMMVNPGNIAANGLIQDVQITLGVSYSM